jgi:predicted ArsR family transcriptional regulator
MKTSRQRVLEFVLSHRVVSAAELSRALQMTPANARHHLSLLAEQGLVEVVGVRPGQGKGRPAQLYSLSQRVKGNNLDRLACVLLDMVLEGLPADERPVVLRNLAERLEVASRPYERARPEGQNSIEAPKSRPNLTQRLTTAVQRLNELNYQARWEAHAQAPRLVLGHCPYAAILAAHPEICQLDAALLESLVGAPVEQTARLARDPSGATYCAFAVGPRKL